MLYKRIFVNDICRDFPLSERNGLYSFSCVDPSKAIFGICSPFRIEATLDVGNTNQGQELAGSISQ